MYLILKFYSSFYMEYLVNYSVDFTDELLTEEFVNVMNLYANLTNLMTRNLSSVLHSVYDISSHPGFRGNSLKI